MRVWIGDGAPRGPGSKRGTYLGLYCYLAPAPATSPSSFFSTPLGLIVAGRRDPLLKGFGDGRGEVSGPLDHHRGRPDLEQDGGHPRLSENREPHSLGA